MKEHETAEVLNPDSTFPVLMFCEHANNKLPKDVPEWLGMDEAFLNSYHGYDLGIPHVARKCAQSLGATCVLGVYSRLLIDLNRHTWAPDILHDHDDGIIIPGNQNLTDAELKRRLDRYYHPYHAVCEYHLKRLMDKGVNPVLFSFHSFPRHQTGYAEPFPWNFTLHYNEDNRVAGIFKEYFREKRPDLLIGDNEPYDLTVYKTSGVIMHGESRGLPYLLIEIPNDQMTNEQAINHWSQLIADVLLDLPEKLA